MNKAQIISFVVGLSTVAAPAMAIPSDGETSTAVLTEAKGDVYKRGFVDWAKQEWGEPQVAKKGDTLNEGMQVGTGQKSWAQIAWQFVTCRAWANSVYAIAPHQRLVYLTNGEMLFHLSKNRKDKDDFCVWTNLLQARIRGTTVIVQAAGDTSRISVLEGTVDVLNKLDHSVVRIKPGVVYTVQAKPGALGAENNAPKPGAAMGISDPTAVNNRNVSSAGGETHAAAAPSVVSTIGSAASSNPVTSTVAPTVQAIAPTPATSSISQLTNIVNTKQAEIPLFDDSKSKTSLLIADVNTLLLHPLVTGLESELSSLPLVSSVLNALPALFHGGLVGSTTNGLLSLTSLNGRDELQSAAEILRAPTRVSYSIGPQVGARDAGALIPISPVAAALFPPQGLIASASSHDSHFAQNLAGGQLRFLQSGHRIVSLFDPLLKLPAPDLVTSPQLPGGISLPGAIPGANGLIINGSVVVSPALGNLGIVAGSPVLPGVTGLVTQGALGNTLGATAGGLTGTTANTLSLLTAGRGGTLGGTLGGTVGTVGGTVNNLGSTLGGTVTNLGHTVGGVVGGVGGIVTNLGNGLGGPVGGLVGGLGGTVGNLGGTLNGTLGGLGQTLGGATNGLTGNNGLLGNNGLGGLLGGGKH